MRRSSEGPQELVILCMGRTNRSEFRDVLPALNGWGSVLTAPTARAARTRLVREWPTPDLIVFAQSYPGEFTDEQVDGLRRYAPLARLIALLGTWCEGEMRSGTPWSGAVRVYWHQWSPHCQQEIECLVTGRESSWSLPPTACEEERCLAIAARECREGVGVVDIVTEQYDVYDLFSAACRMRGFTPRWRRESDEPRDDVPDVVLFDASGETTVELAKLRRLQVAKGSTLIVLADFPRIADCSRYARAGATAVLSRPFFWHDLFWYFPGNFVRVAAKGAMAARHPGGHEPSKAPA